MMFRSFLFLILISQVSFSLEYGCDLTPDKLNDFGNKIIESIHKKDKPLPESILLKTDIDAEFNSTQPHQITGTFEGFFRPSEDDFVSLIPVPILGFDVSRERIVVYACAHIEPDTKKTHLTMYFMRGYHIDPVSFSNFWGDLFHGPTLTVRPIPASLLGISVIKKFFLRIFRFIPFSDVYFDAWSNVQRLLANALGDVTGFGVERVELTEDYVKLSSGVNLESPREALFNKKFNLKKPELGPGASQEP